MQLTAKKAANKIHPTNVGSLKNASKTPLEKTPYYKLLMLLCEGCDANAGGVNFYCTLGATKNADALTLSINLDGDRQTLYDVSLADLAIQAADLVDAP